MKSSGTYFILATVFALFCIALAFAAIINFFCLNPFSGLIYAALSVGSGWICDFLSRKI